MTNASKAFNVQTTKDRSFLKRLNAHYALPHLAFINKPIPYQSIFLSPSSIFNVYASELTAYIRVLLKGPNSESYQKIHASLTRKDKVNHASRTEMIGPNS